MDDSGVTSNFAFIIASGIMLASISSVYVATNDLADAGNVRAGEQILLQSQAQSLLAALFSNGTVDLGNGATTWWNASDDDTDLLIELGLLTEDGTQVAFDKLVNLRLAGYGFDGTDGRANYLEVAEDFGYNKTPGGLGFHIRAKPSLDSVDEILHGSAFKDKNLKVSYIGNVSKGNASTLSNGLEISNLSCGLSPENAQSVRYSVDVKNGDPNNTVQFTGIFDVFTDWVDGDTEGGEPRTSREGHTYLVAPLATETIYADFIYLNTAAKNRVDCNEEDYVFLEVWDRTNLIDRVELGRHADDVQPNSTAAGTFYAEVDTPYWVLGDDDTVVRYYGDLVQKNKAITLEMYDSSGTLVYSHTDTVPNSPAQRTFTIDMTDESIPLLPQAQYADGNYTIVLRYDSPSINTTTQLLVADAPPSTYNAPDVPVVGYDEDPALRGEVAMLDAIAHRFCPFYYNDQATVLSDREESGNWNNRCVSPNPVTYPYDGFKNLADADQNRGDVYPDLKDELEALVSQMEDENQVPRYDYVNTIVVGSNVAHNSMTSGNFKWPLQRWVAGGGTLIVFGSPAQSTNWLNPVFGIKETSSSGGLSAPDTDHPLLNVPEQLHWDEYDSHGYGWEVTSAADDAFTAVVKEGDTPVTVISDPGAFGNGTIVLTTWLPYDITGTGDPDQGLKLMNNFLMQGYRDLFLDYGPPLPQGVPVIPALGFAQVQHPNLDEPVALRITVYVFPYTY